MKKGFILIAVVVLLTGMFSSCYNYNDDDVAISIKENDNEYKLSARFKRNKTRAIQNYIENYTENSGLFKSDNDEVEGTVTLDDNTTVYIKSKKGQLKIKLDKEENSQESYERVKDMCEGIKDLLAEN
jgi:phosphate-selective porin